MPYTGRTFPADAPMSQGRKSLTPSARAVRLDAIAQAPKLADHLASACFLCLFADGWPAFLVPNPLGEESARLFDARVIPHISGEPIRQWSDLLVPRWKVSERPPGHRTSRRSA